MVTALGILSLCAIGLSDFARSQAVESVESQTDANTEKAKAVKVSNDGVQSSGLQGQHALRTSLTSESNHDVAMEVGASADHVPRDQPLQSSEKSSRISRESREGLEDSKMDLARSENHNLTAQKTQSLMEEILHDTL